MSEVNPDIQLGYKSQDWFDANANRVLKAGQTVHLAESDINNPSMPMYKIGDGVNQLQDLVWSPSGGMGVQSVTGNPVDNTDPQNPVINAPTSAEFDSLFNEVLATQQEIADHISTNSDAHDASAISNVPAGNISSNNVQSAINELDAEKQAALGFTPENVSNKDSGPISASATKYPNNSAVIAYADSKVTQTITNGVTTTAPSEDAVFDALAKKQNLIALLGSSSTTRADLSTYYSGKHLGVSAQVGAPNSSRFKFSRDATITRALVTVRAGNVGSNEQSALVLRVNNVTDINIGSIDYSTAMSFSVEFTGLSISVNTTDYYEIKETMQTMLTNPLTVGQTIEFYTD